MRLLIIGAMLVMVVTVGAYSAAITGTAKTLGGGTDNVAHCQVIDYDIPAADTITTINANVECDLTGSYTVDATVTSGASGTGQTATSLTAGTPLVVAVGISPNVTIGSSTYTVDVRVKR